MGSITRVQMMFWVVRNQDDRHLGKWMDRICKIVEWRSMFSLCFYVFRGVSLGR